MNRIASKLLIKGKKKAVKATAVKTKTEPRRSILSRKKAASTEDLQQKIGEKAHELFQRRGCLHGFDQFDWVIAQHLVNIENNILKSKKRLPKKTSFENINTEVEKKAYELFAQQGYVHGTNEFNWHLARELFCKENNISVE